MRYCKSCTMPDTRPGIVFNWEGVCGACSNHNKRDSINWYKREAELMELCNKYRRNDGKWDCIIPVSGGKDSTFLVYVMVKEMNMNPLLVTVTDPFTHTTAGIENFKNLGETFGCDKFVFHQSEKEFRHTTDVSTRTRLEPMLFAEKMIYAIPVNLAINYNIPLIVYGEYGDYEYGGLDTTEDYLVDRVLKRADLDFWANNGCSDKEIYPIVPPKEEHLRNIDCIFLSYYFPWDGFKNYKLAKRYGFRDLRHDWRREGHFEDYDQIDSEGYLIQGWTKYPKYGYARTTDITSRRIRQDRMTRDQGIELVRKYDGNLDQRFMRDFCSFMGYTVKEFWDIVEPFWNTDLFYKEAEGMWRLKNPIYLSGDEDNEALQ